MADEYYPKEHFYKYCRNNDNGIAINAFFQFSLLKYIETQACHTNRTGVDSNKTEKQKRKKKLQAMAGHNCVYLGLVF